VLLFFDIVSGAVDLLARDSWLFAVAREFYLKVVLDSILRILSGLLLVRVLQSYFFQI